MHSATVKQKFKTLTQTEHILVYGKNQRICREKSELKEEKEK